MEHSSTADLECVGNLSSTMPKKKKNKNKRRFSDEQIRSLEVTFESETKLEPKKKVQLAKELGLQPRQVAIWFQNRRARWKSKHIEKEYSKLLDSYNNLASHFESLKKEKQSLLIQVQMLKKEMMMMGKSDQQKENEAKIEEKPGNRNGSTDAESADYTKIDFEINNISSCRSLEGMLSDDDSSMKAELLELDEENELLKMVEPAAAAADSSLTSTEDWGSLDSDDLINHPTETFQWCDFWS